MGICLNPSIFKRYNVIKTSVITQNSMQLKMTLPIVDVQDQCLARIHHQMWNQMTQMTTGHC